MLDKSTERVYPTDMYSRFLVQPLRAALKDTPAVLLLGPRQAGKSTLAKMVGAEHCAEYLTFDETALLSAAKHDPQGFLNDLKGPVVLDEVQRVAELFRSIKLAIDRDRRPGRFLLTGSANVLLLPKLSDSLAGRMEIRTLWPLSQAEIAGKESGFIDQALARAPEWTARTLPEEDVLARAIVGGFPEALARPDPARRAQWFDSYLTALIERDIREIAAIEDWSILPALLALAASRVGSLISYADMARGLRLVDRTVQRYMALFGKTFTTITLNGWFTNTGKRLTKSRKLYFTDSGLLAHLCHVDHESVRHDPTAVGPLLENFVLTELLKQQTWSMERVSIHYFRTVRGEEVDFVLEGRGGRVVGIEVKASSTVEARDFKGLSALAEVAGPRFVRGIVLYRGNQVVPFGKNLWAMPISALWHDISRVRGDGHG